MIVDFLTSFSAFQIFDPCNLKFNSKFYIFPFQSFFDLLNVLSSVSHDVVGKRHGVQPCNHPLLYTSILRKVRSAGYNKVLIQKSVIDQEVENFCWDDDVWDLLFYTCMYLLIVDSHTDTRVECNALMSRVYPKLRDFCHEQGYEFQVVDMRWGVRDPCTDDHMISEISLNELHTCQELSTGPNFVVSSLQNRLPICGVQPSPTW